MLSDNDLFPACSPFSVLSGGQPMVRWSLVCGMVAVVALGVMVWIIGIFPGADQSSVSGEDAQRKVPRQRTDNEDTLFGAKDIRLSTDARLSATSRPVVLNPLVIPDCRLVPDDTQDVPSQREGQ